MLSVVRTRMLNICLRVTLLWWNTMIKDTWRGEGLFGYALIYTVHPKWKKSGQKLGAKTWRQELAQRPWRNTAFCLAPPALFSLLSYRNQEHLPRVNCNHMAWPLPHQTFIKKMPYSLAYSPVSWRHFLSRSSLLSEDFILSQVDIKVPSTYIQLLPSPPKC